MNTSEQYGSARGPWGAVALGVALVAATSVAGRAGLDAFRIRHQDKRVTVTGSATRRIKSDFIVWKAEVKAQAPELGPAYGKLASDVPRVLEYIRKRGIEDKLVTVSSANIIELHPRDREGHTIGEQTVGYTVEETVEVSSSEIDKVEGVSRGVSELIEQGIFIHSNEPIYVYTKLAELKVQMLADASKDARSRADQIAINSGSRVTSLQAAKMGVMQVNPAHSTEVSAEGNNDKTTLEKDVLAIVTASFGVE